MSAKITFELNKIGTDYYADPTDVHIEGDVNLVMLDEFMFGQDNSMYEIGMNIDFGNEQTVEVTLEIWEDWDDDGSWIDYNIITDTVSEK